MPMAEERRREEGESPRVMAWLWRNELRIDKLGFRCGRVVVLRTLVLPQRGQRQLGSEDGCGLEDGRDGDGPDREVEGTSQTA